MVRVLPEVVQVLAAPPDERDAVVGVEHLARLGAQAVEPGAAGQRAEGRRVAVPDPVQRRGAGDVFQPPVRVLPGYLMRLAHAA